MAKVEGYAMVWNTRSVDLGGFYEVIKPSAMNGVINRSDVLCLLDHNKDKGLLARATYGTGSLTLAIDSKGLKYAFEPPDTSLGKEVTEGIRRGDIRTSSFAFTIGESGQQWTELADGMYLREITQFSEIFDVSPVYKEAYNSTSVKLI